MTLRRVDSTGSLPEEARSAPAPGPVERTPERPPSRASRFLNQMRTTISRRSLTPSLLRRSPASGRESRLSMADHEVADITRHENSPGASASSDSPESFPSGRVSVLAAHEVRDLTQGREKHSASADSGVASGAACASAPPAIDTELDTCSICLDDLLNGDMLSRITNCTHEFHQGCLTRWIKQGSDNHKRCPCCRTLMENDFIHELVPQAELEERIMALGEIYRRNLHRIDEHDPDGLQVNPAIRAQRLRPLGVGFDGMDLMAEEPIERRLRAESFNTFDHQGRVSSRSSTEGSRSASRADSRASFDIRALDLVDSPSVG